MEPPIRTLATRAVGKLPAFQREVVILLEFEGRTLAEIAVITEVEVGAVKSRLYRARQQLRSALAPYLTKDSVRVAGEE